MSVPTRDELIEQIRSDLSSEGCSEVWIRRSLESALAVTLGGALWLFYSAADALIRQYHPLYCTGTTLRAWLTIYELTWGEAGYASGGILLTGTDGSVLPAQSLIAYGGYQYRTQAAAIISAGVAYAEVLAVAAGPDSNVAAGETVIVVSPTAGIASTALVDPFGLTGGIVGDTDDTARARLLERMARPAEVGTVADYERWTRAASTSVSRVWVYEGGRDGGVAGTVEVIPAVGGSDPVPGASVLSAIEAYLAARRAAGETQIVTAPTPQGVTFALAIDPARSTTANKDLIEAQLADLFRTGTSPGAELSNLDIRAAISRAGISYQVHTIAGGSPGADVVPSTSRSLLTLGAVTWEAWT